MATADEYAAAAWAFGVPDPADGGTKKPAGTLLGYARHDAYQAFVQSVTNTTKLDELAAQIDALALVAGDPDALKVAVREIVAEVLNDTVLEVRPPGVS